MRFDRIIARNMGALSEVDLDLTSLPGPLVCVTGHNGSGKSTLLGLLLGALYRQCPTRGSLMDLAAGRDSFVEVVVCNGQRYKVRQLVDPVTKKSEGVVLTGDGQPLVESTKVRDVDAFVASHFPSLEVIQNSMFAAQQHAGFLGLKPSERKSVLLQTLGISKLEQMAERAREHRREAKAALDLATARLADERARGGDVAELEAALRDAQSAAKAADAEVTRCRTALEKAREEARQAEQARKDAAAVDKRIREIKAQATESQAKVTDLKRRLANNRAVLSEAPEIRAAVEALPKARERLGEAQRATAELGGAVDALNREISQRECDAMSAASALGAAQRRAASARDRLADRESIEKALAEIPGAEQAVAAANDAWELAEDALEQARSARLDSVADRVIGLRMSLRNIAEGDTDSPRDEALTGLRRDDERQRAAEEHPGRVKSAERAARAAYEAANRAEIYLTKLRDVAAGAKHLASAQADLEAAAQEVAEAQAMGEAAKNKLLELRLLLDEATAADRGANAAYISAIDEVSRLDKLAAKAAPLAQAEARISELEPQINQLEATVARLETELADTPAPVTPPRGPEVSTYEQALASAEDAARRAHSAVAVAEQRLTAARESAARVAELEAEQRTAEAELADWSRLAEDLGRNGLQAAEIDAAGPELTELTNDLLHICHGPRFTVRVDTQKASADGKRLLEGCEVVVIDTERGREAAGETFSGGERVIIGESLSLALSMLACRRAGVEGPTLVRDESGAALDPANARVYVAMLRRAAQQIGASRVLFVAHNPEIQEMADARIVVADGRVQVRSN